MVPTDMATVEIGGPRFHRPGIGRQCRRKRRDQRHGTAASGALVPVDHVIGHPGDPVRKPPALDAVVVDDRAYVIAAGGDDGRDAVHPAAGRASAPARRHRVRCHRSISATSPRWRLVGRHDASGLRHDGGGGRDRGILVSLSDQGLMQIAADQGGFTQGERADDLLMGGAGDDVLLGRRKRHPCGRCIGRTRCTAASAWIASCCQRMVRPTRSRISNRTGPARPVGLADALRSGAAGITPTASGAEVAWGDETLAHSGSGGGRSPRPRFSPRSSTPRTASHSST
jgi:hypothetical protein